MKVPSSAVLRLLAYLSRVPVGGSEEAARGKTWGTHMGVVHLTVPCICNGVLR